MKPNLLQFATEAQASIDREYKIISDATGALDQRESELAVKAGKLLDKERKLNAREKSQDDREEEIVRKEILIRDMEEARLDRESATREHQAAEKALSKATILEAEVKQKEQELYAREIALSENRKTYQEQVRKEFTDSLLGRMK